MSTKPGEVQTCSEGYAYATYARFYNEPQGVVSFDIGDPDNPRVAHDFETEARLYNPQRAGSYLFFDGLYAVDVSDPEDLRMVNDQRIGFQAAVGEKYAFATNQYRGRTVQTVNIDDPEHIYVEAETFIGDYAVSIAVQGDVLAVGIDDPYNNKSLYLLDVSDPLVPTIRSSLSLEAGYNRDLLLSGDTLYYLGALGVLAIIDIANLDAPVVRSTFWPPFEGGIEDMAVGEGVLYVTSRRAGTLIVDVSEPSSPALIGMINPPVANDGMWGNLAITDTHVLMTMFEEGLQISPRDCVDTEPVRRIAIDIKPGDDRNRIPCRAGNGVVSVAVLTDSDFDAQSVDHVAVRFGPNEAAETHENKHGPVRHVEDVDGDGDVDLLFHFRLEETGIQCGETKVTLTGETYGGQQIIGVDAIESVWGGDKRESDVGGVRVSPNPFNPRTTVFVSTNRYERIRVAVYDIRGRLVAELTDRSYPPGAHSIEWSGLGRAGRQSPSGEYFFRVEIGEQVETLKAMLVR